MSMTELKIGEKRKRKENAKDARDSYIAGAILGVILLAAYVVFAYLWQEDIKSGHFDDLPETSPFWAFPLWLLCIVLGLFYLGGIILFFKWLFNKLKQKIDKDN